jgi:exodeoxyribonuclease VII large subunit
MGSLSYQSVLQRGFVLVRDAGGRTLRRAHGLHYGDSLELEFHDGRVDAETRSVNLDATPDTAAPQPPRDAPSPVRRTGKRGGGQGSLF